MNLDFATSMTTQPGKSDQGSDGMASNHARFLTGKQRDSLYRKHVRGAYARSGAVLFIFILFLFGWFAGTYDTSSLVGFAIVLILMIVINPPTLWVMKRIRIRKYYELFSVFINFLEVSGYTAAIYFGGGIQAGYLLLAYAGVISYLGVAAQTRTTIMVAVMCMLQFNGMAILVHVGILPHQNSLAPYTYRFLDVQTICLTTNGILAIVAYMAASTGTILRKNRDNLRTRNKELDSLNHLASIVNRSLNLDDILNAICQELTKIFPVRNAGIALLNPEKTCLDIVAFHTINPNEENVVGLKMPLDGYAAASEVLKTLKPVIINDARTDPRTQSMHEIFLHAETKAIMIAPLLTRGQPIGTIGMPASDPNHVFSEDESGLVQTIASQIAAAIDNAQLHGQIEMALGVAERDLEIGRQIQTGFLPTSLPKVPGWEISSYFLAARQVAGDFYDVFPIGGHGNIGFVIGDVCDKGVGAALYMVVFRSLIRSFSEARRRIQNSDDFLLSVVNTINNYISTTHDKSNMFATVFLGVLELSSNTLHYVNAGHERPIIIDSAGIRKAQLEPTGPAVGLMPQMDFAAKKVTLEPGDILVAFTDGVVDARNVDGISFTQDSLISHVSRPYPSALSLLSHVGVQVKKHIADTVQFDDIAMVALRRNTSGDGETHGITMPAAIENLPLLREFIEKACFQMELSDDLTFAFKLSVDEACTNIITHGYRDQEIGPIRLVFTRDSDRVKLSIYDAGISFDPEHPPEVDTQADWDEREVGGLGLFIIHEMIDEVSYERVSEKENLLTLTKKIEPA